MLLFIKAMAGGVAAALITWIATVMIVHIRTIREVRATHPGALVAMAGGWDYLATSWHVAVLLGCAFAFGFFGAARLVAIMSLRAAPPHL
jgi:hypothetical protein